MKFVKKMMLIATAFAMMTTSTANLHADDCQTTDCCANNGGCGFDACCRSSSLAPAIALGTIALIAIVAVAVQNTSGHSHCHSH